MRWLLTPSTPVRSQGRCVVGVCGPFTGGRVDGSCGSGMRWERHGRCEGSTQQGHPWQSNRGAVLVRDGGSHGSCAALERQASGCNETAA